jgi:hypothetical protein
MNDDERDAEAHEHPQEIPGHPLQDLPAVHVATDPKQLHETYCAVRI